MTPKKAPAPKPIPKLAIKETDLVKGILDALAWKFKGKLKVWRNNTGALKTEKGFMRFGKVGSSDILGVLRVVIPCTKQEIGRFVALEVKVPGKKPTPHQVAWLAEMKGLGALVGVVTSMDEAIKIIEEGLLR